MNSQQYSALGGVFSDLTKSAQREIIKYIYSDKDLDYKQTLVTLSFFVRKSVLSQFEKSRLSARFRRVLKLKCVSYCRANNIVVKSDKRLFRRCYLLEYSCIGDSLEDSSLYLSFRRGILKYLYRVL